MIDLQFHIVYPGEFLLRHAVFAQQFMQAQGNSGFFMCPVNHHANHGINRFSGRKLYPVGPSLIRSLPQYLVSFQIGFVSNEILCAYLAFFHQIGTYIAELAAHALLSRVKALRRGRNQVFRPQQLLSPISQCIFTICKHVAVCQQYLFQNVFLQCHLKSSHLLFREPSFKTPTYVS